MPDMTTLSQPEKRGGLPAMVEAMRPAQWTKNGLVAAAFVFAYFDKTRTIPLTWIDGLRVLPAIAAFCLVSSAVYIMNDSRDAESDRQHPIKCKRPIASGRLSAANAGWLALALAIAGGLTSWWIAPSFAVVVAAYVALQVAYTYLLKHVALLDVMLLSAGFVLRAIAGARIFPEMTISPWLLLCTFLLSLFLGLSKRRHELNLLEDRGNSHRAALEHYNEKFVDQMIAATSGATIVCYALYTLWPGTVAKFGTTHLAFTIPFVVFGIFRYLYLVYCRREGGQPERVLLTDGPTLVNLMLYGVTVLALCWLAAGA